MEEGCGQWVMLWWALVLVWRVEGGSGRKAPSDALWECGVSRLRPCGPGLGPTLPREVL